jgi:hypothetical protein
MPLPVTPERAADFKTRGLVGEEHHGFYRMSLADHHTERVRQETTVSAEPCLTRVGFCAAVFSWIGWGRS